jgi:hypothetical protein
LGAAIVPGFPSLPLVATKTAFAMVPSMPSQLASANPSSGSSAELTTLHWYSQPFARFPSRFVQPALQDTSWHHPELQDADAFVKPHLVPQPPQFVSVLIAVSQPFAMVPSQFAQFEAQDAIPQRFVVEQYGTAFASEHVPQLATVRLVPQLSVTVTEPHSAEACPQSWPSVGGVQPHTFAVPPPPQVDGLVHTPQFTVRETPQLSTVVKLPQFRDPQSSASLFGAHAHTFGVLPPQVSFGPQVPHSTVLPQPSSIVPQFFPCAAQVVGTHAAPQVNLNA